jgi:PKD repeat protein
MKKIVSTILIFLIMLSIVSMVLPVKAHDLPDALHLGYYITPNDPQVINKAQIICGPNFGKTDFWTVRKNVENLYHWVAGSVPHGIPKHIEYMRDQDYWGVPDYWQLSNTTLNSGHGDDEDQAILLASLIRAAGVPREHVRIAKYGVYRLEFPWWGFGLIKIEKERLGCYYAVEVYDISSHPTNLWYHDWWTPLHPLAENLLGWPLPFASCEWLGNLGFENPVCARRLKPEEYSYEVHATDPKARFTYYPQTPRVNETVKFDASISTPNGGYVWKHCWNFGDGTEINVTNGASIPPPPVFHDFKTEGTFVVNLTVFDSEARSNSTSHVIQVKGSPDTTPPEIAITSPQNITYTTYAIDLNYTVNEPVSWVGCTIDDGNYVSNVTIIGNTTLYFTEGSHNIQLFANDTSGNMGASEKIYFTVEFLPPIANFTWSPRIAKVGESVTFDASASLPNGGTIIKYEWNFGDGEHATGQIVTHVYSNANIYTVTLNVTDSEGKWDIEQKQIQVVQPRCPKAEFTVTPETAKVGEVVKFDGSNSQSGWNGTHNMPITEYRWDFGDGNRTTTSTPIVYHRFSSSGIYYVTLTVYAPGATPETDSTTHKVTVITIPVGGYSIPIQVHTKAEPVLPYIALMAILTAILTKLRPKTKRKR